MNSVKNLNLGPHDKSVGNRMIPHVHYLPLLKSGAGISVWGLGDEDYRSNLGEYLASRDKLFFLGEKFSRFLRKIGIITGDPLLFLIFFLQFWQ